MNFYILFYIFICGDFGFEERKKRGNKKILFYFSLFIADDSIDVTNDEEPSENVHSSIAVPNFVGHSLYGHTQVILKVC